MNKRIEELVGQAKFMAEETINKQISKNVELDAFAEKFAKLLIKECAELCTQQYRKVNGFSDKSPPSPNAVYIKEYFGLEE